MRGTPHQSNSHATTAERFPSYLGLAVAAYIVATTLLIIRNSYFALPLFDNWDHWRLFVLYGHYSAFLFSQHNEHRIALPRLFFLIDHYLFGARSVFVLVCNFLVQTASGVALCLLSRGTGRWKSGSFILLVSAVLSGIFSAQQFTNLTWGFQIQFTLVYCASIYSMLALMRAAQVWEGNGRGAVWFCASCVLALAATYSMANGLLVWPILVLLSVCLRIPARYAVVLAMDMILVGWYYTRDWYKPPGHIDPLQAIRDHLGEVMRFAMAYLGAPSDALLYIFPERLGLASDRVRLTTAVCFGAVGLLLACYTWIGIWRRSEQLSRHGAVLAHVAIFVAMTAGVVGLGRVNFPLVEATTSRYRTPALIFWLSLAAFYWLRMERRLDREPVFWRGLAFSGVACWLICGLALRQPAWIRYSHDYAATVGNAEAAITAGVFDEPAWKVVYHTPSSMLSAVDYLRENRLSVFSEPWTTWTGRPAASLLEFDDRAGCEGAFDSIAVVDDGVMPGWRVSGWAWDRKAGRRPKTIILADENHLIAGVVRHASTRTDVYVAIPDVNTVQAGWSGYVRGSGRKVLTAYLGEADGRTVCKLGTLPTPEPRDSK